jgi:hypothetical protein
MELQPLQSRIEVINEWLGYEVIAWNAFEVGLA